MAVLLGGAFRVAVIVFRKAKGRRGEGGAAAEESLTGLLRSVI